MRTRKLYATVTTAVDVNGLPLRIVVNENGDEVERHQVGRQKLYASPTTMGSTLYDRVIQRQQVSSYDTRTQKWKAIPHSKVTRAIKRKVNNGITKFNNMKEDVMFDASDMNSAEDSSNTESQTPVATEAMSQEHEQHVKEITEIHDAVKNKPEDLILDDLTWKMLVRSVKRGKNIMMTGPAGSGKSMTAYALSKTLDRPLFVFNLGATQDPRAVLIGQTHFAKDKGTFFNHSLFVQAIQEPGAIILLDETSRAHPEAANILMTVLDQRQRYLRVDEEVDSPTIKVADGVCFVATANIGTEYTGTRTMDHAFTDRFLKIEMEFLNKKDEEQLLRKRYPYADQKDLGALVNIAEKIRTSAYNDESIIETSFGTRATEECAELLQDGFTLSEVASVGIYPLFPDDGSDSSERAEVKQICQAFIQTPNSKSSRKKARSGADDFPF